MRKKLMETKENIEKGSKGASKDQRQGWFKQTQRNEGRSGYQGRGWRRKDEKVSRIRSPMG